MSFLKLGLLLACDWLLSLRMTLWEKHGKEEGFTQETCPGFYQDLEALSKLVKLLPSAISRVSQLCTHTHDGSVILGCLYSFDCTKVVTS